MATKEEGEARKTIRVGLMLPLSGPNSAIGTALFNAASLALFDAHDRRIDLIPLDTQGTPEGTMSAMDALLPQRPDVIIGPLFSGNIQAIKARAQDAGISIIGFSTDHNVAGDGVYLLSFPPKEQIRRVVAYSTNAGYGKFAALIPETAYGSRILEIYGPLIGELDKELVSVEFYPPNPEKLFDPVKKIANYAMRRQEYLDEVEFLESLGEDDDFGQELLDEIKNLETLGEVEFDAILLPEGGALLTTLAPLLAFYEIDPAKIKVMGTGLWHDRMLIHEPQLIGGWFAGPENARAEKFMARYEGAFGKKPPRLTTLGYDAMALVATLVRTKKMPDYSAQTLTNMEGFLGLDGIFRFRENGLVERGLAVYEVTRRGFKIIDPAPTDFIPPVILLEEPSLEEVSPLLQELERLNRDDDLIPPEENSTPSNPIRQEVEPEPDLKEASPSPIDTSEWEKMLEIPRPADNPAFPD